MDQCTHTNKELGRVINAMIRENRSLDRVREIFDRFDEDGSGKLDLKEFIEAYKQLKPNVVDSQLEAIFNEADLDGGGTIDFDEFSNMANLPYSEILGKADVQNRDERGLVQVEPSTESYFGEELRKNSPDGVGAFLISPTQRLSMELYESRIASMQRFVAMTVMFHQVSVGFFTLVETHQNESHYCLFRILKDGYEGPIFFSQNFFWLTWLPHGPHSLNHENCHNRITGQRS